MGGLVLVYRKNQDIITTQLNRFIKAPFWIACSSILQCTLDIMLIDIFPLRMQQKKEGKLLPLHKEADDLVPLSQLIMWKSQVINLKCC